MASIIDTNTCLYEIAPPPHIYPLIVAIQH